MDRLNPLFIFDFDDTLIKSREKVHVFHGDGTVSELSTHEYTMYRMKSSDYTDFRHFEKRLRDPIILSHYGVFLNTIDEYGADHVVVLTARKYSNPPRQWLQSMGVKGVRVIALGAVDASEKANWIKNKIIEDEHDFIMFYDDNLRNIKAVRALMHEFPDVEIFTKWIR